jgi:uncharacterized protein YdgA (DUF945 family)
LFFLIFFGLHRSNDEPPRYNHQTTTMNYRNTILGLLVFFSTEAQAQADLNDFLSVQSDGKSVFLEYDYQAMLDSIDVLNAALSSSPAFEWGVYSIIGTDIDGEAVNDNSGHSVSLSSDGTTVAIGAIANDGNGHGSGHVRIYSWNSTTSAWEQQGTDIDGEAAGDWSSQSVSLSSDGTTVAIGADDNAGNGTNSGHVRIYSWNSTTSAWEQQGADIDGEAAGDNSGYSVSLSSDGTTVAIGANGNDGNGSNSGHVRIYSWNSTTSAWEQQGADLDGEAAGDNSGYSISLSSDGTTVAIGANGNDGNGNFPGHVRIYSWNSTTSAWDQQGGDIDDEAANDWSGFSVSLSSDGTTVAIGAPYNDGNGTSSGHVRIYSWH